MPSQGEEGSMDETARVRDVYEKQAPYYDRVIAIAERLLFAGGREWACRRVHGDVLEVGVGTGRNLPCFPEGIALSGIELSPAMLAQAQERARRLGRTADLRVGDAQRLPFADATFDTVLATLTLCSIPDDVTAVAEMARVLRPGGRLVLLDHVASPSPVVRAVQRLLEPLFLRLAADHLLREPDEAVRRAGLMIEELSRSRAGLVLRLTARRP